MKKIINNIKNKVTCSINICLIVILLLSCTHVQSYIEIILHAYNPATDQHVFLLGDIHQGKACGSQQKNIMQAAQALGAHIIVEDMLIDVPEEPPTQCTDYIAINCLSYQPILTDVLLDPLSFNPNKNYGAPIGCLCHMETPIVGMTNRCHRESIPVVNVECRLPLHLSELGYPISGHEALTTFQRILDELSGCDDGPILNGAYKAMNVLMSHMLVQNWFQNIFTSDCTIAQAIKQKGRQYREEAQNFYAMWRSLIFERDFPELKADQYQQKYLELAKKMSEMELYDQISLLLALYFVDMQIVHQIFSKNYTLFVLAGSLHIRNVSSLLAKAGYILVDREGKTIAVDCGYMDKETLFKNLSPVLDIKKYFDKICVEQFLAMPNKVQLFGNRSLLKRALALDNKQVIADLLNIQDNGGCTELMRAALSHSLAYVAKLLNVGARTNIQDNGGLTALSWAILTQRCDSIRLLARAMPRSELNIADSDGVTPLMLAARTCPGGVIHDLINNGADVTVCDNIGKGPVHYAVYNDNPEEAIRALALRGADFNKLYSYNHTPLVDAVSEDKPVVIKLLCKYGAAVDKHAGSGTALTHATMRNKLSAARALVECGAQVEKPLKIARMINKNAFVNLFEHVIQAKPILKQNKATAN